MSIPTKPADNDISQIKKMIRETPIEVELVERTMERYKKSSRGPTMCIKSAQRKAIVTAASAAVVFTVILGTGFISPTIAASMKKIPGMDSIFQFAGDLGLKSADEKGFISNPNLSDTHKGFTLHVPEVMFDGTRVSIGLERETSDEEFLRGNVADQIYDTEIRINGEPKEAFAPVHSRNAIGIYTNPGKDNNSTIMQFSDLHNQGGKAFPDKFELTLSMRVAGVQDPFHIHIPVEKNTMDNVVLAPSISRKSGNINLKLEKVEFTPITTSITTRIELSEHLEVASSLPSLSYELYDDKGRPLKMISNSGWSETDSNVLISDNRFEPFTSIPKSITIKPYTTIMQEGDKSKFELDHEGNPQKEYFPQLEVTLPVRAPK